MRVDLNPVFIRKDTEGFPTFIVGGMGSVPGQETKIPHAMWLKKKKGERDRHEPKDCAKKEAETGMMQPQAKEFQRLLATTRSQER